MIKIFHDSKMFYLSNLSVSQIERRLWVRRDLSMASTNESVLLMTVRESSHFSLHPNVACGALNHVDFNSSSFLELRLWLKHIEDFETTQSYAASYQFQIAHRPTSSMSTRTFLLFELVFLLAFLRKPVSSWSPLSITETIKPAIFEPIAIVCRKPKHCRWAMRTSHWRVGQGLTSYSMVTGILCAFACSI